MFSIFGGRDRATTGIPLGYEWDTRTGRYGRKLVFDGSRAPHLLTIGPTVPARARAF